MDAQLLMENYKVLTNNEMQSGTANMPSVLEYAKKRTQHRQNTSEDETDVTKLVAMMIGLFILFTIYVIVKCFIQKSVCSRCEFTRVDGRVLPCIHFVTSASGSDQSKSKWSPPPPYEHPPSYQVALELESMKKNEDRKVLSSTSDYILIPVLKV